MGLFDEVLMEYPMPDPEIQDSVFQTKSMYNAMENYTVTSGGQLILHKCHYEEVPEEERPYFGTPEWEEEKGLYKFFGSMVSVYDADVPSQYHGMMEIHTILPGDNSPDDDEWYSYDLTFEYGILVNIQRRPDVRI